MLWLGSKESSVLKLNFFVINKVNTGIPLHNLGRMPTMPISVGNRTAFITLHNLSILNAVKERVHTNAKTCYHRRERIQGVRWRFVQQYISTTDSTWLIQTIENMYSHNHDNIRSRPVRNISWDWLYLENRLFVVRWPISTQTTICWLRFKGQIKSMRIKWYVPPCSPGVINAHSLNHCYVPVSVIGRACFPMLRVSSSCPA